LARQGSLAKALNVNVRREKIFPFMSPIVLIKIRERKRRKSFNFVFGDGDFLFARSKFALSSNTFCSSPLKPFVHFCLFVQEPY